MRETLRAFLLLWLRQIQSKAHTIRRRSLRHWCGCAWLPPPFETLLLTALLGDLKSTACGHLISLFYINRSRDFREGDSRAATPASLNRNASDVRRRVGRCFAQVF